MQLFDSVSLGETRVTSDGYLVADVRAGRVGIQTYAGFEVNRPEKEVIRVYRPADEVFSDETLGSFTSVPITLDHPDEAVNARNWKKFAIGYTGEDARSEGRYVRVPLILKDAAAIEAVQNGKRELSFGYTCDLKWEPGVTEDGEEYDAIQQRIRGNHLAIVSAGRAGSTCRIGDHADDYGVRDMTAKLTVDGIGLDGVSDTTAQVVSKALKDRDDEIRTLKALVTSKDSELSAKDKQLGALDGEVETLRKKQLDQPQMDTLVAERFDIVAKARAITPDIKTDGIGIAAIKRAVVVSKFGENKVSDKSDDYVGALFDSLAEQVRPAHLQTAAPQDAVRSHLMAGGIAAPASAGDAHSAYVKHLNDAWKRVGQQSN